MNDIENIKAPDSKKQKGFLNYTIEKIEIFCTFLNKSKAKTEKSSTFDSFGNINNLSISSGVKSELLAMFNEELEKGNSKVFKS
jgi:hypothetical protein